MIIFNCACIVVFRRRSLALKKRSRYLEQEVTRQLERIGQGMKIEDAHKQLMSKKLKRVRHLLAFDEMLESLEGREPEVVRKYLDELYPVFLELAIENPYRSLMKLTYFAHFIGKYKVLWNHPISPLTALMLQLLKEPGLYCRENALYAIYSSGNCKSVLRALEIVDEGKRFHHAKLLTDGLLTFAGDRDELTRRLWQAFPKFSAEMQVVILDYIRFSGADMKEELLQLMADSYQDDEIRFSCIRYFGKYPYEPAYPFLVAFAENREQLRWEYTAIAVTALSAYPRERSIEVLKENLSNPNWYVRFNAAGSLEHFSLTYSELSDVFEGNDRYAREILQYRMDMRSARIRQEEQTV